MAIRPIRLLGDPVLRTVAEPVTSFDAELRLFLDRLRGQVRREALRAVRAAPLAAAR